MLNSFYDKFIFTSGLKYKHDNFFLLNLPFVILPIEALVGIADLNDSKLNTEIYYAVKKGIVDSLKKEFRVDFGVEGEKGLEFMESYFTASGWGKLQRADLDTKKCRAMVNLSNSPVANNCSKAEMPVDTFVRGFLAGIFSIYFKKDVDCVEVKCSALGSPNCNFVIKEPHEFDFKNKFTRSQLKVE